MDEAFLTANISQRTVTGRYLRTEWRKIWRKRSWPIFVNISAFDRWNCGKSWEQWLFKSSKRLSLVQCKILWL